MFTALLPPRGVVAELDDLLEPRRAAGRPTWRWTRPEGWHITTSFMGSVADDRVLRLIENLADVASRTAPIRLRLAGALCFPSPDRAKILALATQLGTEEAGALAQACRAAASRAGVEADGARFVPHLTLARANRGAEATKWVRVVDSFPGWDWTADELVLVASHLADKGNRYEVVERFALVEPNA